MEPKEIKLINITLLFLEPLNHLLITTQGILELFKIGDKIPQHSLIEAPGLKVFIFPERKKEIIFEMNRLLINDRSGSLPQDSEVIDYLFKILEKGSFIGMASEKVAAHGFNYDILIGPQSGLIQFNELIGNKISKIIENIEEAGIRTIFEKEKVRFDFQLNPVSKEKLIAHLNAHYREPLPQKEKLNENLLKQYEYFISLIKEF